MCLWRWGLLGRAGLKKEGRGALRVVLGNSYVSRVEPCSPIGLDGLCHNTDSWDVTGPGMRDFTRVGDLV